VVTVAFPAWQFYVNFPNKGDQRNSVSDLFKTTTKRGAHGCGGLQRSNRRSTHVLHPVGGDSGHRRRSLSRRVHAESFCPRHLPSGRNLSSSNPGERREQVSLWLLFTTGILQHGDGNGLDSGLHYLGKRSSRSGSFPPSSTTLTSASCVSSSSFPPYHVVNLQSWRKAPLQPIEPADRGFNAAASS
jgi:hypothetical protein